MKILQKALSLLTTLVVLLLVFLAYGSVENRWYRVIAVDGNSMSPTLWYGDMILVTPPPEEIPPDSIVVMSVEGSLVTHRLLGFDESGRPITKGDANESIDQFTNPNLRIVGLCRLRLPGFGYPLLYLSRLMGRA
jgi:signal peptidase I